MKKLKNLVIALVVTGALTLAACKEEAPAASSTAPATQTQASSTAKATVATLGYDSVPEQLIRILDQARYDTPKRVLTAVENSYYQFLLQIAGVPNQSDDYLSVKDFQQNYLDMMQANQGYFGLGLTFATDMANEAISMESASANSGYPKLPTENKVGAYAEYREALIKGIKDALNQRLTVYKDLGYQKMNFAEDSSKGITYAQVSEQADKLVADFNKVLDVLTQSDIVCSKQADDITKSQCFLGYVKLIAELPDALESIYYLHQENSDLEAVTPQLFRENVVGNMVSFYNEYAKPLNLEIFTTK